ncbi:beta-galactosidase/beta-glucuronidase-like protein [Syntrophobotulus glycolicus DSM 8271]|uniref:Beta-galactosidase/beta-glucuronidase-like protein n=1 Tax=Syntrophobotulus glycolicus (strain DSM 8271 / FlGlyR) TaxID=645991 RepID=F0SZY7_SYNGF|nr:beta-galactosidase/beta-glucuronidase-like protein [Syntrophobotulus glycolicus]ADY54998.1 beta-galactosidase/beta-glucuronidase-like protein [Syntrophobotulus glycolicus DSM 8271]
MFKRLVLIIISLFALSLFSLCVSWHNDPEVELYSDSGVSSFSRLAQDLSGKWSKYSSIKEAFLAQNDAGDESTNLMDRLSGEDSIVLPSSGEFKVVAKQFKVNSKWGARNSILALDGVYGKVRVYLNGINHVNVIGEFDGYGETHNLEIQPSRFDYGKTNTLFIETIRGGAANHQALESIFSPTAKITGKIILEAVTETSIDLEHTSVDFEPGKKQLLVNAMLWHHESLQNGPWVLEGKLIRDKTVVAQCLLPLASDGSYRQKAGLVFDLPEVSLWSPLQPELYELDLTVSNAMGDQDSIQFPVGLRTAEEKNGKILLNGSLWNVQGIALTPGQESELRHSKGQKAWLAEQKKNGFNMIYFVDQFPDESWLSSADQIGMGIWAELPAGRIFSKQELEQESLEIFVGRARQHPSLLAWTIIKGLDGTEEEKDGINERKQLVEPAPVFALDFRAGGMRQEGIETVNAGNQTLSGAWGSIAPVKEADQKNHWPQERLTAIIWALISIVVAFQGLRSVNWRYKELDNGNPKRKLRRAFFWSAIGFICRMFTLAAVMTDLIFRIPQPLNFWLQEEFTFIGALQSQQPLLLILTTGLLLALCRLLQVGVAAPAFPGSPEALSLTCWLERRYVWFPLVAVLWVLLFWNLPIYVPAAVYVLLTVIAFPIRFRDCRRIGAKYRCLFLVPLLGILLAIFGAAWNYSDFLYLYRIFMG